MMSMHRFFSLVVTTVLALTIPQPADDLDAFIQEQMAQRQINGLSLAVIQDGKIQARAYGVTARGGAPVTTDTLFQAGSISKPVAAMGALKLVEQGKLSLDEDVNAKLKTLEGAGERVHPDAEGDAAASPQSHRRTHRARFSGIRRQRQDAVHRGGARRRREYRGGSSRRRARQHLEGTPVAGTR